MKQTSFYAFDLCSYLFDRTESKQLYPVETRGARYDQTLMYAWYKSNKQFIEQLYACTDRAIKEKTLTVILSEKGEKRLNCTKKRNLISCGLKAYNVSDPASGFILRVETMAPSKMKSTHVDSAEMYIGDTFITSMRSDFDFIGGESFSVRIDFSFNSEV